MSDAADIRWTFVAAADRTGLVGQDDGDGSPPRMPWHLSDDLRHFKRVTMGRPVVMGRKTFDSIGRALPGRLNVVLSRRAAKLNLPPGVAAVADVAGAARAVRRWIDETATPVPCEAFVIGGAEVFAQFLPLASRIHLTEIDAAFDGNRRVAPFAAGALAATGDWREASRERCRSDDGLAYDFVVYERTAAT